MALSDIITIIGTIVTIISMIVTIIYANKAKSYKEQIQFDIRKINLSNIVEKLKRTQDEIRKLPKTMPTKRGVKVEDIIVIIKAHFDYVLNFLDSDGPDTDVKIFITNAQKSLNTYEINFLTENTNADEVVKLTEFIQEAISKSNTKILKLEKDL
jgi:hypothetical protein